MHYHVLFCIYNWNYCGTFVVPKFLLPLETLDFTGVYLPVDFNVGIVRISLLKYLCHCIKVFITLLLIRFTNTYFYIYLHSNLGYWYKIGTEVVQNNYLNILFFHSIILNFIYYSSAIQQIKPPLPVSDITLLSYLTYKCHS